MFEPSNKQINTIPKNEKCVLNLQKRRFCSMQEHHYYDIFSSNVIIMQQSYVCTN